jgi:hypothetical protein
MWTDPIVDEIHKIRQANAERFNHSATPITERIAAMNLPVDDWEIMEKEIEA